MTTIGVTGGVGAGKSEILRYLQEATRCRILYTDDIANDLKRKGAPCYAQIVELLGEAVLDADGEIDRGKMAARIFSDDALKEAVNAILHPAVEQEVLKTIASETTRGEIAYLFIEAALLIEAGYGRIVDEMWYVFADEAVRRKRLKESRGYEDAKIDGIFDSQLREAQFRAGADFVIDNSGALDDAFRQIDAHLRKIAEVRRKRERTV